MLIENFVLVTASRKRAKDNIDCMGSGPVDLVRWSSEATLIPWPDVIAEAQTYTLRKIHKNYKLGRKTANSKIKKELQPTRPPSPQTAVAVLGIGVGVPTSRPVIPVGMTVFFSFDGKSGASRTTEGSGFPRHSGGVFVGPKPSSEAEDATDPSLAGRRTGGFFSRASMA